MPQISVIIPVYNTEEYLKQCIDSVLNQEDIDVELILLDDGSTGTVNITDSTETTDVGQQEETEDVEEIEIAPEEETDVDAVSDVDVTFE